MYFCRHYFIAILIYILSIKCVFLENSFDNMKQEYSFFRK